MNILQKSRYLYIIYLFFLFSISISVGFADETNQSNYVCCVNQEGMLADDNLFLPELDDTEYSTLDEACQFENGDDWLSLGAGTFCIPQTDTGTTNDDVVTFDGCCCGAQGGSFAVKGFSGTTAQNICESKDGTFDSAGSQLTYSNRGQCSAICNGNSDPGNSSAESCSVQGGQWCDNADSEYILDGPFSDEDNQVGKVCATQCSGGDYDPIEDDGTTCVDRPDTTECPVACKTGNPLSIPLSNENYVCCTGSTSDVACASNTGPSVTSCILDQTHSSCSGVISGEVTVPPSLRETFLRVQVSVNTSGNTHTRTVGVTPNGEYEVRGLVTIINNQPVDYVVRLIPIDSVQLNITPTRHSVTLSETNSEETDIDFTIGEPTYITISGLITNSIDNVPISNAWIFLAQTVNRATANSQGEYTIEKVLPNKDYTYRAGYAGFIPDQASISVVSSNKTLNVELDQIQCQNNIPPPSISDVSHTRGELGLNFSISANCLDELNDFRVLRKGGDSSSFFQINSNLHKNSQYFFDDDDLEWDTDYVYILQAKYDDQLVNSSEFEVLSGNEECEGQTNNDHFCSENDGFSCTDDNRMQERVLCDSDENLYCQTFKDGESLVSGCYQIDGCMQELRSVNPFGIVTKDQCEDDESSSDRVCYFDKEDKSYDTCKTCKPEMTCFQYQTESACTSNVCSADLGSGCNWVDAPGQTGLGYCVDAEEPICEQCADDESSLFGFCDNDTCFQLGTLGSGETDENACYYNSQNFECLNCDVATCYDYDTEASCEEAGNLDIDPFTNKITPGDQCGVNTGNVLGACRWVSNECVRDFKETGGDDCAGLTGDNLKNCKKDRTPPITFAVVPSFGNPNNAQMTFQFIAIDKDSTVEGNQVNQTRFCIDQGEKEQGKCGTAENFAIAPNGQFTLTNTSMTFDDLHLTIEDGTNVLYYYSIDSAKNYEIVKTQNFTVFINQPTISNIHTEVIPGQLQNGQYRSDIQVDFNTDRLTQCSVGVVGCEETNSCPSKNAQSSSDFLRTHTLFVESIVDGSHQLKISCNDKYGNNATKTTNIIANADSRIYDMSPSGPIDTNSFDIELSTVQQVDCRYTNEESEVDNPLNPTMSSSSQGLGFEHKIPLSDVSDGTYAYYVKCNFDNPAYTTIQFTVDTQKPTARATTPNGQDFEFDTWIAASRLMLHCDDEPEGGFGCEGIRYCTTSAQFFTDNDCTPDSSLQSGESIPIPENSIRLCYYAQENTINGLGARRSDTVCGNILTNNELPNIVLDPIIYRTNLNSIDVSGSVFPITFRKDSVSLSENSREATLEDAGDLQNLWISGDISVEYDLTKEPVVEIRTRYIQASNVYYALVIDASDPENPVYRFIRNDGNSGETIILADQPYPANSKQEIPFEIRHQEENSIFITLDSEEHSVTDGNIQNGVIHFDVVDNAQTAEVTVKNIELADLDADMKTFIDIDVSESGSQSDPLQISEETSPPSFDFTIPLTDGDIAHGQEYELTFRGRDEVGRQTGPITKTVVIDLQGPVIENLNFVPAQEQETNNFIEYRQNAIMSFDYSEDSEFEGAEFTLYGTTFELTNASDNSVVEFINLHNIPLGKHDINISAVDSFGNVEHTFFPNALFINTTNDSLIIDPADPSPNPNPNPDPDPTPPGPNPTGPGPDPNDPDPNPGDGPGGPGEGTIDDDGTTHVNVPNPSLRIRTQNYYECTFTYTDEDGIERVDDFTLIDEDEGLFEVDLSHNLPNEQRAEVLSNGVVFCTNPTETEQNTSLEMPIVVDRYSPTIAVLSQDPTTILRSYTRDSKIYDSRLSGLPIDVFADEPVICKFSESNQPYSQMSSFFPNTANNNFALSTSIEQQASSSAANFNYYVSCVDRAGNAGYSKQIQFEYDPQGELILGEVSPIGDTNIAQPTIQARVIRDDYTCNLRFDGGASTLPSSNTDGLLKWALPSNYADKEYTYEIICESNTYPGGNFDYSLIIDTQDPELEILTDVPRNTNNSVLDVQLSASEKGQLHIRNPSLVYVQNITQGTHTVKVPLTVGDNKLDFILTDGAGNSDIQTVRVQNMNELEQVSFGDNLSGSIARKISSISVETPSDLGSATLRITRLGDGETEEFSSSYPYSFSVESFTNRNGVYNAEVDINSQLRARSSFEIDTFAENHIITQPDKQFIFSLSEVTGSLNYRSLILPDDVQIQVGSANAVVDRDRQLVSGTGSFTQGEQFVTIQSVNEIGHTSSVSKLIYYNLYGPRATSIRILGNTNDDRKVSSPIPKFEVQWDSPAKIRDVYITSSSNQRLSLVKDYSDDVYYTDLVFTLDGELIQEGSYTFEVQGENRFGISGNSQKFNFEFERGELQIEFTNPSFAISPTKDTQLILETDRNANCYWSNVQPTSIEQMNNFSTTGQNVHIHNYSIPTRDRDFPFYFVCEDFLGENNLDNPIFQNIRWDSTKPTIDSLQLDHSDNGVYTKKDRNPTLIAQTNEPSICRYSTDATLSFSQMIQMSDETEINTTNQDTIGPLRDQTDFTYYVKCQNGAELVSDSKSISFTVDTNKQSTLFIKYPTTSNTTLQQIVVESTQPVSLQTCTYELNNDGVSRDFEQISQDKLTLSSQARVFNEGTNTIGVECFIDGKLTTQTKEFIVDVTPPEFIEIKTPSVVSRDDRLEAQFKFRDNESAIIAYDYAIGTTPFGVSGDSWFSIESDTSTRAGVTVRDLSLEDGETYYWSVRAINRADLTSQYYSSNGTVVEIRNNTSQPPSTSQNDHCTNGIQDEDESDIDCGGSCKACSIGSNCSFDSDCENNGFCIEKDASGIGYCSAERCPPGSTDEICQQQIEEPVRAEPEPEPQPEPQQQVDVTNENESSGFNIWLLLLLILLVLILLGGGAGYYVTEQKKKETKTSSTNHQRTQPQQSMRPLYQNQQPQSNSKDRLKFVLAKKLKEAREKNGSLDSDKASVFSAFDDEKATSTKSVNKKDVKSDVKSKDEPDDLKTQSSKDEYKPKIGTISKDSSSSNSSQSASQDSLDRLRVFIKSEQNGSSAKSLPNYDDKSDALKRLRQFSQKSKQTRTSSSPIYSPTSRLASKPVAIQSNIKPFSEQKKTSSVQKKTSTSLQRPMTKKSSTSKVVKKTVRKTPSKKTVTKSAQSKKSSSKKSTTKKTSKKK